MSARTFNDKSPTCNAATLVYSPLRDCTNPKLQVVEEGDPSALVIDHVESETISSQELHTSVVLDGEKYNIGGFYKFPTGGDIYSITALLAWG